MKKFFNKIKAFLVLGLMFVPSVVLADVVKYDNDKLGAILPIISPGSTLYNIAAFALSLIGLVCVSFIIYGGFMWAVAAGSQDKISKAKGMIIYALIGLVITLSAALIGYFVTNLVAP